MKKRTIATATQEEKQDLMALSRAIEAICKRNKNEALRAINEVIASKNKRIADYNDLLEIESTGLIATFQRDKMNGLHGDNYHCRQCCKSAQKNHY